MKELYKDIYDWIKNPDDIELSLKPGRKVLLSCQILLLEILLAIPFLGLGYLIHLHIVKLNLPLEDLDLTWIIVIAVIIAPVIEEFIFRFPLKYRRNYLVRLVNRISGGWLKQRWNSIFKYFFYLLAILFGLVHLSNYENTETIFFILSPIIVGSQLIGGFLLGYIRIKLGFIWAIVQHGAFNLAFIVLGLVFFHNSDLLRISDENFSIGIKELMFINEAGTQFKAEFDEDLIYSVDGTNISLYGLMDSLELQGPKPYDDRWINVNIYSENGITKNELQQVFKREIRFEKEAGESGEDSSHLRANKKEMYDPIPK